MQCTVAAGSFPTGLQFQSVQAVRTSPSFLKKTDLAQINL